MHSLLRRVLPTPVVHALVAVRNRETRPQRAAAQVLRRLGAAVGRARGDGPVLTGPAWRPLRGTPVADADLDAARGRLAAAITDLLRREEIEYATLAALGRRPERLVVSSSDRTRLATALARDLPARCWVDVTTGSGTSIASIDYLAGRADRARRLVIYEHQVAPDGTVLAGPDRGVHVDFWDPLGTESTPEPARRPDGGALHPGALRAPTPDPVAENLSPATWARVQDRPTHEVPELPHLLAHHEPIDAVYTWVDGSDPIWRERFHQALNGTDTSTYHASALAESRYAERDELRYSLRSLQMYANWLRHIYIVTDGQRPAWLRTDHPRVTIVDHRDIFRDPAGLPVFNSHAIESQLHHIPGLAQRYLYLNDDVFFGAPVMPDDFFFSNGIARFFLSEHPMAPDAADPRDLPVSSAAKSNRAIVESLFHRTVTQKFQHTPHPQLRDVLEEMEQRLPEEFDRVSKSTFRGPDDISIPSALHHYYAYAVGRAVPGTLRYEFFDLADSDAEARLSRLALRRNLDVFCLNDTASTGPALEHQRQVIGRFCQAYYPVPSTFEATG